MQKVETMIEKNLMCMELRSNAPPGRSRAAGKTRLSRPTPSLRPKRNLPLSELYKLAALKPSKTVRSILTGFGIPLAIKQISIWVSKGVLFFWYGEGHHPCLRHAAPHSAHNLYTLNGKVLLPHLIQHTAFTISLSRV